MSCDRLASHPGRGGGGGEKGLILCHVMGHLWFVYKFAYFLSREMVKGIAFNYNKYLSVTTVLQYIEFQFRYPLG